MGAFLLAALLFTSVEHVFPIEELNGEFKYSFTDLGNQFPKYGDTMFCFLLPECSNSFSLSWCLIENNKNLGCLSDPEEFMSPVVYMYPIEHTYEHCVIFPRRAPWSNTITSQVNIWREADDGVERELIISVRR